MNAVKGRRRVSYRQVYAEKNVRKCGKNQIHGQVLSHSEKLELKVANIDYEIKKRLAFSYYLNPTSTKANTTYGMRQCPRKMCELMNQPKKQKWLRLL